MLVFCRETLESRNLISFFTNLKDKSKIEDKVLKFLHQVNQFLLSMIPGRKNTIHSIAQKSWVVYNLYIHKTLCGANQIL